MSDDACKHIGQSVICPFCRERILMCPASERDAARQDAERARAEVERVKGLIDRDRTGLAAALVEVKKRAAGGQWISEGRGSYRYDEADYRKETGWLVADIIRIAEDALRASGNLANEAFHPTPGPVPGRGLDPATVEACARVAEKEQGNWIADSDGYRVAGYIAKYIRVHEHTAKFLTSPADMKGRPNGK